MTETKKTTGKSTLQDQFKAKFGRRNQMPVKRSPHWDEAPAGLPRVQPIAAWERPAEVYGTPAIRPVRFGIIAACLALGAIYDHWKPPAAAFFVVVPALFALFFDNKRWILRDGALDIEYSNAVRTKVVTVRAGDFRNIDTCIVKGSGSDNFVVSVTLTSGKVHTKTYTSECEADVLKDRVLRMFRVR
jgi:hypothetical protein